MNEQYLFNKVPISRKMQDTGNETVYAPGEMLFKYNGTEKEIILPEGIKTIENSAFANNYSVEYVKLPDSVEFIRPQAFWCSSIKNIDLSSNLIEIGDSAFRGSKLEKINLPPSVKYIRRGAFMECINLKSASLPEGLEEIGHNAFQWCYELKEINIPKSVKFLGKESPKKFLKAIMPAALNAFGTCSSSATIPISKKCMEDELGVSNKITSIVVPLGATVNMDAVSILMSFMIMFFANACGIEVSVGMMIVLLLANVLLSIGTPGVPGGAIASFAALATMAGLPAGVMGVYISINTLCDMGATCVNVVGDLACCSVLKEKVKLEEK